MKHLRSISARLTLAATLAVGVFGLAVSLLTIEWVHADLDRSVREFARHEVHELANIVASAPSVAELGRRSESLAGIAPEPGLVSVAVYDLEGRLVYAWPRADEAFLGDWSEGLEQARQGREAWREVALPDRPLALEVAAPVTFARQPRWLVMVGVERERHEQEIRAYMRLFAIGLVVLVLLTAGGTWVLVGQALAPVQRLVRDARLMAEESRPTSRLSPPTSADELAELAALVNRLLDRLSGTIERLEQFTAHAGHELRTPLSRIRADAEQALTESDLERLHGTLRSVLEEVDLQKRVIDALFELARASDQLCLTEEPEVSLDEIVRECVEDLEPLAEAKDVATVLDLAGEALVVRGNRVLLVRAIWNVLDNAVKYADVGKITVRLHGAGSAVELRVTNAVSEEREIRPEIAFTPFARMTSEDESDSGLGLGLALTRSIVERHHGSVGFWEQTEDQDGKPARQVAVSLRLPRSSRDGAPALSRTLADMRS